ncbi:MAG: DUF4430 domain-containing protein [Clostridia bacterium]|nr:DUF4430 domain-containing protein [Clostridia bacterium]
MKSIHRVLSLVLMLALLLSLAACGEGGTVATQETPALSGETENSEGGKSPSVWDDATYGEDKSFGNGSKKVEVEVKVGEKSVTFTLNTDKENLADALLEHQLVEGEDGPYGLYVKKVNGITADYDADGHFWSLSQSGTALMSGVSDTKIAGGEHFEMTYTKG